MGKVWCGCILAIFLFVGCGIQAAPERTQLTARELDGVIGILERELAEMEADPDPALTPTPAATATPPTGALMLTCRERHSGFLLFSGGAPVQARRVIDADAHIEVTFINPGDLGDHAHHGYFYGLVVKYPTSRTVNAQGVRIYEQSYDRETRLTFHPDGEWQLRGEDAYSDPFFRQLLAVGYSEAFSAGPGSRNTLTLVSSGTELNRDVGYRLYLNGVPQEEISTLLSRRYRGVPYKQIMDGRRYSLTAFIPGNRRVHYEDLCTPYTWLHPAVGG